MCFLYTLNSEDYMTWKGPNPDNRVGSGVTPEGPETRDRKHSTLARGSNPNLSKGPAGLAKGSIYQKLNKNMFVR